MSDNGDIAKLPEIELFIKAAPDREKKGGCPQCHQWFIVFYCMAEKGHFNLTVTTIALDSPPKYFTELGTSGRLPDILVKSGVVNGIDISKMVCDTNDEIENFMLLFGCPEFQTSQKSKGIAEAEKHFQDLYRDFNAMLKSNNSSALENDLKKVDGWLKEQGTQFLLADELTYADAQLIPKLHHIRVAGKFYTNFEINPSLTNLWSYMGSIYKTDAFRNSCPADQTIVKFYEMKVPDGTRKTTKLRLQEDVFSWDVPESVVSDMSQDGDTGEANGDDAPPANGD